MLVVCIQIPFRQFEYKSLLKMVSRAEPLNESKDKRVSRDDRSEPGDRSGAYGLSDEESFLGVGRFSCNSEYVGSTSTACVATEWRDYAKSGRKPADIPAAPHHVYANDGWAGWGDWLEMTAVATYVSQYRYRSFKKARAFVSGLGLESKSKWRAYCKSATKPDDIPANPQSTYAETGWAGWDDWLGYEHKH